MVVAAAPSYTAKSGVAQKGPLIGGDLWDVLDNEDAIFRAVHDVQCPAKIGNP